MIFCPSVAMQWNVHSYVYLAGLLTSTFSRLHRHGRLSDSLYDANGLLMLFSLSNALASECDYLLYPVLLTDIYL